MRAVIKATGEIVNVRRGTENFRLVEGRNRKHQRRKPLYKDWRWKPITNLCLVCLLTGITALTIINYY